MNTRLALNLVLILVVAGLSWVIWFQPNTATQSSGLFNIVESEVSLISVAKPGQFQFELEKRGEDWFAIKPGIVALNNTRIRHILTILNEPVYDSIDASDEALQEFKLKPGRMTLAINQQEIIFGMANPVTHNRYFLKNNKILIASEAVYGTLASGLIGLLSHHLLLPNSQIAAVESRQYDIELDKWQQWENLQANGIADYAGDEKSQGELIISLENGAKIPLEILQTTPKLILGRPDLKVRYTLTPDIDYGLIPK
jgi:hypothetical protein